MTTAALYAGGNELFFSYLQAMMESLDDGTVAQAAYEKTVRRWGETIGRRAELPQGLPGVLSSFGQMLQTMGLARTFEPLTSTSGPTRVLVLRALDARYVGAARLQAGKPYPGLIRLLLEGVLAAADLAYTVTETREGMERSDEQVLVLVPRSRG